MKIKLYQIAPEKDDKKLMFMSYKFTVLHLSLIHISEPTRRS